MNTNTDLDQAREWAKDVHAGHHPEAFATAKVIASLPDEWIDAAKLREVIWEMRENVASARDTRFDNVYSEATERWAEQLEALLPDPKPRTLADMDGGEREACQWMQADFDHGFADPPLRVVIGKCHGGTVDIILPSGGVSCVYVDKITPLPDLRRMGWPGEQATDDE